MFVKYEIFRQKSKFGIMTSSLSWCNSYLSERTFSVLSSEQQSMRVKLSCSFPQRSTLGLLLYVTYTAELQTVAEWHGVRFHGFADETQLSISVDTEDAKLAKQTMIDCVSSICQWSSSHRLKLNLPNLKSFGWAVANN